MEAVMKSGDKSPHSQSDAVRRKFISFAVFEANVL